MTYFLIGTAFGALELIFETGSMPKLQKLVLNFCDYDRCSWTNGNFDFGIGNLACLTSVRIRRRGYFLKRGRPYWGESESKASFEKAIEAHPNHPSLEWDIRSLVDLLDSGTYSFLPVRQF